MFKPDLCLDITAVHVEKKKKKKGDIEYEKKMAKNDSKVTTLKL